MNKVSLDVTNPSLFKYDRIGMFGGTSEVEFEKIGLEIDHNI